MNRLRYAKILIPIILLLLNLIGGINITLLNLYFNSWINLPKWYVHNGLRAAYDLYLYPYTLIANAIFLFIFTIKYWRKLHA